MRSRRVGFAVLACAVLVSAAGCQRRSAIPEDLSPGVVIEQAGMSTLQENVAKAITSAPTRAMRAGGLAGALGGARVKVLKAGTHEVLLPIPQLANHQVPVSYSIATTPGECAVECRLCTRDGSNVVVRVQLNGSREQEVQIHWASVVLISPELAAPDASRPELYRQESACVQSGAPQVTKFANQLWPGNGKVESYAANIQEFIRNLKQQEPPRSMDAVGILESGANWICTANANLAAALLRAKGIPARSVAVIPTTAQRLEMHRVVEYFDRGRWLQFDPSSLQRDIPLKPWQNVIMTKTTIADESLAMKPRLGTSLGCPYGQELEFLDGGITLWGKEFFWTMARPLAEFDASNEAAGLAMREWMRFLETGKLSQEQVKAASTTDAVGFLEALRMRPREPSAR